jgi:hypothetical protein
MAPGSVANFTATLTQAIEDALTMEWLEHKNKPLPNVAVEDRRVLFAAIAQGVLTFIKAHESDFKITAPEHAGVSTNEFRAPQLTASVALNRRVTLTGKFFGANRMVKVRWEDPNTVVSGGTSPSTNAQGSFTYAFDPPGGSGQRLISARDASGAVAVVRVSV